MTTITALDDDVDFNDVDFLDDDVDLDENLDGDESQFDNPFVHFLKHFPRLERGWVFAAVGPGQKRSHDHPAARRRHQEEKRQRGSLH